MAKYSTFKYCRNKYGTGISAWVDSAAGNVFFDMTVPINRAGIHALTNVGVLTLTLMRQFKYGEFKYGAKKYGANGNRANGNSNIVPIPDAEIMEYSIPQLFASANTNPVSGNITLIADPPVIKGCSNIAEVSVALLLDTCGPMIIYARIIVDLTGANRGVQQKVIAAIYSHGSNKNLSAEYQDNHKNIEIGGKL
jgi:hypothetical protein